MKKKQHILIAIVILACWFFLGVAFATGRFAQLNGDGFSLRPNEKGEIHNPFSLKAVTTFLLQ